MSGFPIDLVRSQFPALADAAAFLDNPAGTQLPRTVIEAVCAAMSGAASNLGGYFRASQAADAIHARAHEAMADLLGAASPAEILVGQSMTTLTFQIARSLARAWQPGDELIVTRMDHEGNVSPWLHVAEERGLTVRWLGIDRDSWRIEPGDLRPLLNPRTRLLALNYASNLSGSINPVAELTRLARQAGALVYVDAVQFAPHGKVEVGELDCDFLACSAYKFFGPHIGVLWGRASLLGELHPYAARCASPDLPGRHETGTPQTELLAGLAATVDYLAWLGAAVGAAGSRRQLLTAAYRAATSYEMPLAQQLIEGLLQMPGVRIHGITSAARLGERVPTISMTHAGRRNAELARALAAQDINVWSGHNYAYEFARYLGLDEDDGVLRIGLAHYNTAAEVESLLAALRALLK